MKRYFLVSVCVCVCVCGSSVHLHGNFHIYTFTGTDYLSIRDTDMLILQEGYKIFNIAKHNPKLATLRVNCTFVTANEIILMQCINKHAKHISLIR